MFKYPELLRGASDLHVHAGPSVMPREVDAADMMRPALEAGLRAYVVKDHYFPTMMSAAVAEKHLGQGKVRVFGGLALNDAVGGLNLRAVDVAWGMRAKFIWMPTISTKHHIESHSHGLKFPSSTGMRFEENPLVYVDAAGKLDDRIPPILDYMGTTDMILGTGHGTLAEVDALTRAAAAAKVERILVNHPLYMIGASVDDCLAWAGLGAFIELNATVFVPESKFGVCDITLAAECIKRIGPERIVIDSDYGQKGNGCPIRGLDAFIALLIEKHGVKSAAIETMVRKNPAALLGL